MSNKLSAFALALCVAPSFAFATESTNFANCYGDHHGSYLDLFSIVGTVTNDIVQVNIARTDDAGLEPEIFQVVEVTKNGAPLQVKAYSWAIRQAIHAVNNNEFYGFVKVKAVNVDNGELLYMNVNKFGGSDAMSIDGYIESLTCSVNASNV